MSDLCIYCSINPCEAPTFERREHVFPRSLGGTVTFKNREVCDRHNETTSDIEDELARHGIEAFSRMAHGPDGRSIKRLRQASRRNELVGPPIRRLEGKNRAFLVKDGIVHDVIPMMIDEQDRRGMSAHLLPAVIMIEGDDGAERTTVHVAGSDVTELHRLLDKIRDEEPFFDTEVPAGIPQGARYHPRVLLDGQSRLVARGFDEQHLRIAASAIKKLVISGEIKVQGDEPNEELLKPIHFRQAFNIVKVLRCGGKIMLNMIAWAFGAAVAREGELDALRIYVLAGQEVEEPVRFSIELEPHDGAPAGHTLRITATAALLRCEVFLYGTSGFLYEGPRPKSMSVGAKVWTVIPGESTSPPER